ARAARAARDAPPPRVARSARLRPRDGRRDRKDQPERRTGARCALDLDPATLRFDHAVADRQPESRAAADVLGREEGLEDALAHGARHPDPVVADGEYDVVVRNRAPEPDVAPFGDRVAGVG